MILSSYKNYILKVYRYTSMPYSVCVCVYMYHTYLSVSTYLFIIMHILIIYIKETLHWMELNRQGRL